MKLAGKTILITGGSSGIGLELASQLVGRGNRVIVTGRNEASLQAAKAKVSGLHTIRSDVGTAADIAALHARVTAEFPRLTVLVNNAGIMRKINLQTFGTDLEDIVQEIEINLSGSIRMTMQFLPHLLAQSEAAVVNVSSGLAFVPYPIAPIYGATKAGLHSFTQSLRVQLARTNVQIFEIAPPAVDTPLNDAFAGDVPSEQLMKVTELVSQALRGLEKNRPEIRVGLANALGMLSRIAPGFILRQLSKPVDQMLGQRKQLGS